MVKTVKQKLNKYQIAAQEITVVMGWEIDDEGTTIDAENWTDEDIIVELRKAAAAREPGDEFTPPTAALLDSLITPSDPEEVVPVAKAEVKVSAKAKEVVAKKVSPKDKKEEVEEVELPVELPVAPPPAAKKDTKPAPKVEPKAAVKAEKKAAVKEVPAKAPVKEVPVKEVPVIKEAPKVEAKVAPKKEVQKAAKKAEKKPVKKAVTKAAKKEEGPKVRKPREQKTINHAMMYVRELVVKNPDIQIPEVEAKLAEKGFGPVHKNSIVVRRMEMRHCLTILKQLGMLKSK